MHLVDTLYRMLGPRVPEFFARLISRANNLVHGEPPPSHATRHICNRPSSPPAESTLLGNHERIPERKMVAQMRAHVAGVW